MRIVTNDNNDLDYMRYCDDTVNAFNVVHSFTTNKSVELHETLSVLQHFTCIWNKYLHNNDQLDFSTIIFSDAAELYGVAKRWTFWWVAFRLELLSWIASFAGKDPHKHQVDMLAIMFLEPLAEEPRDELSEMWFASCLANSNKAWLAWVAFDNQENYQKTLNDIFNKWSGRCSYVPSGIGGYFPQ